jgi:hypothetical protein
MSTKKTSSFFVRTIKNQKGVLTIDFMFALVMAAVLVIVMFAFSMSLTMLEIAQYIAFSTARAHASAHLDQEKQTLMARQKFRTFLDDRKFPALAPLLKNNWFEISERSLEIRGGGTTGANEATFNEIYAYRQDTVPQTGVRFKFQAKILKIKIPFVGAITEDSDFTTYVTGFLIREPTSKECKTQFELNTRFKAILDQDSRFRSIYQGAMPKAQQSQYFGLEDNGC